MTELAIIGSDIQEVVGSAIAFRLLFGWPLYVGCLITGHESFFQSSKTIQALHSGLGLGDQRGTPTLLLASWDHKPKKVPQRMENSMATFFPEEITLILHLPGICGG